ncbi:MAG: WXG100 family type VII secretion target [Erysipelotrichaceae bacterium]|nr:WXG100 family type VII secretion target [Erysipelotrichaceae bacterium]
MALTNIQTAKMKMVQDKLTEQIGTYRAQVNKLNELGAQLDPMWEGDSAKKFKAILTEDQQRFEELAKMMQKYVEAIEESIRIYSNAEVEASEIITANRK